MSDVDNIDLFIRPSTSHRKDRDSEYDPPVLLQKRPLINLLFALPCRILPPILLPRPSTRSTTPAFRTNCPVNPYPGCLACELYVEISGPAWLVAFLFLLLFFLL